ncbi:pkinase-domain-containing protein [Lichtheimia corymbifera JMRC:FSU:9682]|uniref:non-specific serine/threonine protein kinase n=1 Tax=Lichtheimia corymbifera JMRC:FSU:9682 TaxID=1263082 RepID=A0A068RHC4_9FUNG|nr:pkinase-domain-containing protein [Lichtheimia corymbifera JMRC:FSU:9682]
MKPILSLDFLTPPDRNDKVIRQWMQSTLDIQFPSACGLHTSLRDGVYLCKLMKHLRPASSIEINYEDTTDSWAQNIQAFLEAAGEAGLHEQQLFSVDDLLEGVNMDAVLTTLSYLHGISSRQTLPSSQSQYIHSNDVPQQPAMIKRRRGFTVPTCPDNGRRIITTTAATTRLYDNRSHVLGDPINEDDGDKEIECSKEHHHHHHHHHPMQQQFDYQHNESACTSSRRDTKKVATTTTSASYGRQSVLSSLSDDALPWERGATPPYGNFDHPPVSKSPAVESTSSGDSGYAKSYYNSLSGRGEYRATTPEHLVSLFDPPPPSSSSSPISINNTTTADTSIQASTTTSSGSTRSRLSRFSSLSFAKKLPIRQKIPFHMRYQEWTDLKLKKRRPASLIVTDDEPPLSPNSLPQSPTSSSTTTPHQIPKSPAPSTSSPISLLGTNNIDPSSHVTRLASPRDHNALPPLDITTQHMVANLDAWGDPSPGSSVRNGTVPRRKSTGTLEVNASLIRPDPNDNGERLEMQQPDGNITARYKLGNSIGKGQFGTVHRALNLKTGQMVAIKRIKLESTEAKDIDDVMQEAQLLQALAHPNIVKYEGFIRTNDCVNIVLEYVENGSLANTLKSFGNFPENLVASYCSRILEGLVYLHDQNVVHCDLKAANILTTKTGDVKLSDFGVSVNLQLKETVTGSVAGTPNWMAPEVIQLQGASTKSDIWSLGCTIIELFTGKPPYADLIPMTTLFRIVEDECPPLPTTTSQEMMDFLQLCFRKSPNERPTARELLDHPWIVSNASYSTDIHQHQQQPDRLSVQSNNSKPISSSFPRSFQYNPVHEIDSSDAESITTSSTPSLHRGSILVNKLHERQEKRFSPSPPPQQEHCFVKGSFAKASIRCKACQLPIKRNALVCEGCGFICHDKCRGNTMPCRAPKQQDDHVITPTPSISSSSSSCIERASSNMEGRKSPRPTSSMSTQLRERTKKLSRVFTSSSNGGGGGHSKKPHSTRSHETLRFIREDEVLSSGDLKSSLKNKTSGKSPIATPNGAYEGEIRNSTSASYIEHSGLVRSLKHKRSRTRQQQSNHHQQPSPHQDDCVIS